MAHFPKRFLWGASTSAHQVEGGTHNQWSVWELEHARSLAARSQYHYQDLDKWDEIQSQARQPKNYVSAEASDHYVRYEDDFKLLSDMHMNAFRFSIEWSRVEPEEGAWNVAAIEHYKSYVKALKRRDIEPVVTLFHFTLPVWFAAMGGFEKRRNVRYFVRFAEKIAIELGSDIKFIITINEPMVYAHESYWQEAWPPALHKPLTFWRVVNNLAYAHNKTAQTLHGLNRRYRVSVAKNSCYFYAGDNAWLSKTSAMIMQFFQDDYFLRKVRKTCDFIGMNYYFSFRVYGYRVHNPEVRLNDLGWDMSPATIQFALERLSHKYGLPILITENGLADADDAQRKWWISQTLAGIQNALAADVQVLGYLHWSLLDNFEWDKGFWPRFGLAQVDYATQRRTLRPSAVWLGNVIKKLRSQHG